MKTPFTPVICEDTSRYTVLGSLMEKDAGEVESFSKTLVLCDPPRPGVLPLTPTKRTQAHSWGPCLLCGDTGAPLKTHRQCQDVLGVFTIYNNILETPSTSGHSRCFQGRPTALLESSWRRLGLSVGVLVVLLLTNHRESKSINCYQICNRWHVPQVPRQRPKG